MAGIRVSPGQVWAEDDDRATPGERLVVNEVYDTADPPYATMNHRNNGRHAFTATYGQLRDNYRLIKDVPADTPRNPAEQRAAREGLPVVLMDSFSLGRVIAGHSLIVKTKDGGEALVRLYRPDEFMAAQHAAVAGLLPGGPPPLTLEEAERLVAPVRFP
jgi:hypothetical protein